MPLPLVDQTPLLLLRFSKKASQKLISLVIERLKQNGLVILTQINDNESRTVLSLTTKQEKLEEQAQAIHLVKQTHDTKTMELFTVQNRSRFCKDFSKKTNEEGHEDDADDLDIHGLFSSHEWSLLIYHLFKRIDVLPPGETSSKLSRLLDTVYHADYLIHLDTLDEVSKKSTTTTYSSSKLVPARSMGRGQLSNLLHQEDYSAGLCYILEAYDLVDDVVALHIPVSRDRIMKRTISPWYRLNLPIHEIHRYYGWETSFYFAWLGFLTKWAFFPGCLGCFVVFLRLCRNDTLDEDEYTPFYGLVAFLWSVLGLRYWDRQENRLAYQWGTFSLSRYERQKYFALRPQFRGYLRKSPISGQPEVYYPDYRRRIKYLFSAIVTCAMLMVAFVAMILSLNLQGYIRPKSNLQRWNREHPHPFYFQQLAALAEQGQLLDATSAWRSLIPVGIHVAFIFTLNQIYRTIAEALTNWENHETEINHKNSLVVKRFLFEAFDCYVALFYLAFYERDVERLRMELMSVFQIDTFRRLVLECGLPIVLQHFTAQLRHQRGIMLKKTVLSLFSSQSSPNVVSSTEMQLLELIKDPYEEFDDYIEMVIEYGYVTLFASAYPLAPLISTVANWIEARSDCFKLSYLCRRPVPLRTSDLGMWKILIACIVWMSALTNCLLAGFTSDQLMHYMPTFYIQDETGYTTFGHEKGWLTVFVIFGLERVLILAGLLIYAIVPAVPEDVTNELERRQYIRWKEEEERSLLSRVKVE